MEPNQIPQQTPPPPDCAKLSPEQIIVQLRARVSAGQSLTRDQVREALAALRQNRISAADAAPKARKSATPTRSATELLAGLKSSLTNK